MKKRYFFMLFLLLLLNITSCSDLQNNKSEIQSTKADITSQKRLPAIEIKGTHIFPIDGISLSEAHKLLIEYCMKKGLNFNINSETLKEITIKEAWENAGIQLFSVNFNEYVVIIKDNKVLGVLYGMPILSIFLADLDNDNIYEVYTNFAFGSGIISDEISGFNIALNEGYRLSRRMKEDFTLFVKDSTLMAKVSPSRGGIYKTGKVVLKKIGNQRKLEVE